MPFVLNDARVVERIQAGTIHVNCPKRSVIVWACGIEGFLRCPSNLIRRKVLGVRVKTIPSLGTQILKFENGVGTQLLLYIRFEPMEIGNYRRLLIECVCVLKTSDRECSGAWSSTNRKSTDC